MSTQLDLCFVESTGLIREAVRHVLDVGSCDAKLREELVQWQDELSEGGGRERRQVEPEYHRDHSAIPFELVCKVHQQLKANPLGKSEAIVRKSHL